MSVQLEEIINTENEEKLLSSLRSLDPREKAGLIPEIKKINKRLSEFGQLDGNTYGYKNGTNTQRELIAYSGFVCLNRKDFEQMFFSNMMLDPKHLSKIIDWYCPDWFSDFINKQVNAEFLPHHLHYDRVIDLNERGYLNPSKELIALLIPQIIFETTADRKSKVNTENLLKKKITLQEHIWYIFEYKSNIHAVDRYLNLVNDGPDKKTGWLDALKKYSDEKRIDRIRLLKESLLASNRNFNKILSGWFTDVFAYLDPSAQELILIQSELFSVLVSAHSKPVNNVLKYIKTIMSEKEFLLPAFLDHAPQLITSDTKATSKLTLTMLEKLAGQHKDYHAKICVACARAFIHSDKEVQQAASKIISKFGDTKNEELCGALQQASDTMLAGVRSELKDFLKQEISIQNSIVETQEHNTPETLEELPFPSSVEDMIFLASQAFDNNQIWHIDVLPAALLTYGPKLKVEDLPKLEPAFQRALGLLNSGPRSTTGQLDSILAFYFVDFGHWLFSKFKEDAKCIIKVFRKYDRKTDTGSTSYTVAPANSSYLVVWKPYRELPYLEPYRHLLLLANDKLKQGNTWPLLSTPTHTNGSISADTLIARMAEYQANGGKHDSIDLQIAISRCTVEAEKSNIAKEKLKGEWKELMIFLLEENAKPIGPFHNKETWLTASFRKKEKKQWKEFEGLNCCNEAFQNYTGELKWSAFEEEYEFPAWDHKTGKQFQDKRTHKILRVFRESEEKKLEKKEGILKKLVGGLTPKKEKKEGNFLFDYMRIKFTYAESDHNDIARVLSMMPYNPSPLTSDIINCFLRYSSFNGEGDKRFIVATLQSFYANWQYQGEMEHLFLATCMLFSEKNAANIAGEIWIKYATGGYINNARLGQIIGIQQQIEFVPLKRFTDLVSGQLIRVSPTHNRLLQDLIENIFSELPHKPVRNLKKLLEIHEELLSLNNSEPDSVIAEKIKMWKKVNSKTMI